MHVKTNPIPGTPILRVGDLDFMFRERKRAQIVGHTSFTTLTTETKKSLPGDVSQRMRAQRGEDASLRIAKGVRHGGLTGSLTGSPVGVHPTC